MVFAIILTLVVPASGSAVVTENSAATIKDVLIVELQIRSGSNLNAANEEFIELYNSSDQTLDVSSWQLEYKSATGSSWNVKATLNGMIGPKKRYLLASDGYLTNLATTSFNPGLSDSAGHVRLVNPDDSGLNKIVRDLVGWGSTANAAEGGSPAPSPGGGRSLKRLLDSDGYFIDTDNNQSDFEVSDQPSPETDPLVVIEPDRSDPNETVPLPDSGADNPVNEQQPDEVSEQLPDGATVSLKPLQITELMPNPAPPAKDESDEFIELLNPSNEPIDLAGYKLQAGSNFSYSYTFKEGLMDPGAYRAFYITETDVILANSTGKVRLIDPNGQVVSETDVYEDADDGAAWVYMGGNWQWSTTPTPGTENVLTAHVVQAKSTKASTTAKKSTAKAKTASSKAPKSSKSKNTAADRVSYQSPAAVSQVTPLHPSVLAVVAGLALVYGAYEYRQDMANRIYQFKRYRAHRRESRKSS